MRKIGIAVLLLLSAAQITFAGNPERAGQAGGTQLLINPWARSSGLNGLNLASSSGIESVINNPAGLAHTKRTELVFSHTRWLVGSEININTFGFSQAFRKGGVIGIYAMAFDIGEIERTTENNPDGGLGTFKPTVLNLGVSYAKAFTEHIFVGATAKMIHESITDVSANGVAFDAGVQYKTGGETNDRFKFGLALRNVGPEMRFAGDGLSQRAVLNNNIYSSALSRVADKFQLPSVLQIGVGYDFVLDQNNKITAVGAFISNTFSYDQFGLGGEYRFKKYLAIRASYLYEQDIFSAEDRRTAFTGFAGGATVEIPFKSGKDQTSSFGLDYSYRTTNPFSGTHSFGVRIDL